MTPLALSPEPGLQAQVQRLTRQLARERAARQEAEAIAERGLRELYESQRWLALLQRITVAANSEDEVHASLAAALREICTHTGWDFGNAYLVDAERRSARACDVWFASEPARLFDFVEASRAIEFACGEGLPGMVLRDRRGHSVHDVCEEQWFVRRDLARAAGLTSVWAFPIMVKDEVVAICEFFSGKPVVQHERLLDTVEKIGVQLGRVIERDRSRKALLHDALHDALTGLPNRLSLTRDVQKAHARFRPGDVLAAMVIDLDGFKAVNDKYGHFGGDELIVEAAARLRRIVDAAKVSADDGGGAKATVARVGGDEFVVLFEGRGWLDSLRDVAASLHDALAVPLTLQEDVLTLTASIGLAFARGEAADPGQMLRDADLAMYEAKARGRARTVTFTDGLGAAIRLRRAMEQEMRTAIRQRQFCLHYQPIVASGGSNAVLGYEALLRWQHPDRGLIGPADFIPVAEESGLIIFLGDWVLEEACRAAAELRQRGALHASRFLSVNVAAAQFLQPSFPARVRQLVMEHGIDPHQLRIEITESVAIRDPERTAAVLAEIREWGVQTSLDDFGTGYSSLSNLQRLPIDCLKIDRSFINELTDPKSLSIVKAILDLARSMRLTVVAEGIEREDQLDTLRAMGCDYLQGFLLGQPAAREDAFRN
jgi:diguanylate cyclase (GGDEF)-like protein